MLYAFILFAQKEADKGAEPGLIQFAPIILIGIIFFVLIILPGRKEKQQRQTMMNALKKNDRIITSGGIIGVVINLKEGTEEITIRSEDAKLLILRSSVARIITESDKDPSTAVKPAT
jgi:preprotein translocase subunit YajC